METIFPSSGPRLIPALRRRSAASVDLAAMTDLHDEHQEVAAHDLKEHAIIPNAQATTAASKGLHVGGGNGSLLVQLLRRRPGLRGIVLDLPETNRDDDELTSSGVEFVSGDFFDRVPSGDVYILSTILHDWDDERATAILRTIHAAAPRDARLLVVESVVQPGNEPDGAKWLDLLMLALFAGRERNEEQWRALLAAGGFQPIHLRDGLIEARCR